MTIALRRGLAAAALASALACPASAAEPDFQSVIDKAAAAWSEPDGSAPATPAAAKAEAEYVIGKAAFTLMHEFGHAVIDDMGVPVIVQEEAVADSFAGTYLISTDPDPARDALANGAIRAFMDRGEKLAADGQLNFTMPHLLDTQRGFNALCLMMGSVGEERFGALATELDMPADRRSGCPAEASAIESAWLKAVPAEKRPADGASSAKKITIRYDDPPAAMKRVADILKASGLLEALAAEIELRFQLPYPILLTAQSCGEPNEMWFPDDHEIGFCYEYLEYYQELGNETRFAKAEPAAEP